MRISGAMAALVLVCGAATAADLKQVGPLAPSTSLVAAQKAVQQDAFEVEYKVEAGGNAETDLIDIGADTAMLTRGRRISIFDHGIERYIDLDDAAHKFRNDSWYGVIDARTRATAQARAARNMKQAGFDAFWVQSELHVMAAEDGVPDIARRDAADGTAHYSTGGAEVASFAPSEHKLSPEDARRFGRFLLDYSALHPRIVADIVASGAVPARMSYLAQDGGKTVDAVWTLQSFAAVKAVYPLARSVPVDHTGRPEPVIALLASIAAAPKHSAVEFETSIAKALKAHRPFQALLLAQERDVLFGACKKPCRTAVDVEAAAKGDPRTAVLTSTLALDKELEALKAMKRDDLTDTAMLDARLGHVLVETGHIDEALPALAAALRADAGLPGVYRDLGDVHRASGDSLSAWLFYDLGRALPGGAEALRSVTAYEATMVKAHPELF